MTFSHVFLLLIVSPMDSGGIEVQYAGEEGG